MYFSGFSGHSFLQSVTTPTVWCWTDFAIIYLNSQRELCPGSTALLRGLTPEPAWALSESHNASWYMQYATFYVVP